MYAKPYVYSLTERVEDSALARIFPNVKDFSNLVYFVSPLQVDKCKMHEVCERFTSVDGEPMETPTGIWTDGEHLYDEKGEQLTSN